MKARIESNSKTVYGNNIFEKLTTATKNSSAVSKATTNKITDDHYRTESNDNIVNKYHQNSQPQHQSLSNGNSNHGTPHRTASPSTRSRVQVTRSDDCQNVKRELHSYPLHFDTREILEETPLILKSLKSGLRGPDTFVYLPTEPSHLLSENEDPCKTFVISSVTADFVNRKNSLNQSGLKGVNRNKIGVSEDSNSNEYLSYVIEKSDDGQKRLAGTMSQEKSGNGSGNGFHEGSYHEEEKIRSNGGFESDESDSAIVRNGSKSDHNQLVVSNLCVSDDYQDEEEEARESQHSSGESGVLSFDRTITGKKEQAFAKLQDELEKAHQELKLKDEEVARLTRIREDVERELEELTASLFQEAHKMVSKAKEKQAAAEKSLAECQMKMDVLSAEVVALKTLVLTSTPSRPNPHLHPHIGKEDPKISNGSSAGGVNIFNRKHRRSPSHFNLKYGRENSPPDSPVRDQNEVNNVVANSGLENHEISEVDPIIHKEFLHWSLNCRLDKTDPFIDRIYREDINLCLDFSNRKLAEEVQKAIETRDIFIEAVTDKSKTIFPRKCALLEVTRQCHYRMKLGDQDTWYNISQMCRNRIIAVCDFINYLRYIELGLVKSSAHEMYWEIMRFRKKMVLARLGLSSPSS